MAAGILCGTIFTAVPVSAAPPTSVDFTVTEDLNPATPGVMTASDIAECPNATVATTAVNVTATGPVTTFTGTKLVDCGGGHTFSLSFRASANGCSATDSGRWKLTGGTGVFSGAKGGGSLVGSYLFNGAPSNFCEANGIDDRYTGKIKLAT